MLAAGCRLLELHAVVPSINREAVKDSRYMRRTLPLAEMITPMRKQTHTAGKTSTLYSSISRRNMVIRSVERLLYEAPEPKG